MEHTQWFEFMSTWTNFINQKQIKQTSKNTQLSKLKAKVEEIMTQCGQNRAAHLFNLQEI
jgi:hypothetical protein